MTNEKHSRIVSELAKIKTDNPGIGKWEAIDLYFHLYGAQCSQSYLALAWEEVK